MRKRASHVLVDTPSWVAGVMDSSARFHLWQRRSDEQWQWEITLAIFNAETARKLAVLTGCKVTRCTGERGKQHLWRMGGKGVLPLLGQLIPRMFCLHEQAGVLYRHLLTKPGRRIVGKATTQAVHRYREEMREKLIASKGVGGTR